MVVTAVFWMPALMKGVGALASLTGPSATVAHANIQKNQRRIAATGARSAHRRHPGFHHRNRCRQRQRDYEWCARHRYSVDIVAMGDDISQQMVKDVAEHQRRVRHVVCAGGFR